MTSKNTLILEQLINEDFGLRAKEGSRWGKSEDHTSLVLDRDKSIFFWNSQEIVGDSLTYLQKVRHLSFRDSVEILKKMEYEGTHTWTLEENEEVTVYPKLVEVFWEMGKNHRDYFYRRGLTDDTINRFQLGFYNGWNTVPFFEDGTFRNFQFRMDLPSKRIKSYYKNLGALLFNSDILRLVDEVYWCEGVVDAIIMLQNGIPAIASNIGGGFRPEWYSKFLNVDRIHLVFDRDSAGDNESKRVAKYFGDYRCRIFNFWDYEEKGYDICNYFGDGHSGEEILELIKENEKYVFEM
jgi:DNA primase